MVIGLAAIAALYFVYRDPDGKDGFRRRPAAAEARLNGKLLPSKCDPATGFMVVGAHKGAIVIEQLPTTQERIRDAMTLSSMMILLVGMLLSAKTQLSQLLAQSRSIASERFTSACKRR